MRMRQYICHTNHNLWDVIVNGDLEEEPAPTGETSAPKKMQKNVLKHLFENFSTASNESLDKAYDRFQKLISQLEVHDIDEIDIDDLYNNLRVYEDEMKRYSSSTSTSQNLAFLSSKNTSSTNPVEILGLVLLVELIKFHLPLVLMM
ncbi:hypothetical protein Tco_0175683 [Tanacetum coccineum]